MNSMTCPHEHAYKCDKGKCAHHMQIEVKGPHGPLDWQVHERRSRTCILSSFRSSMSSRSTFSCRTRRMRRCIF